MCSKNDEAKYGYNKGCRQKKTYDGIQEAEETAAINQHESCCDERKPREWR